MNRIKKKKTIISASIFGTTILLGIGVLFTNNKIFSPLRIKGDDLYHLFLNSDNKQTSSGEANKYTAKGGMVRFTYTNVASSTNGHVTLNQGGSLVNKDIITSITAFTANFDSEGALSFKVSYDGATWGGSTVMESDYVYPLGSNPYFIMVEANKAVTINSLSYSYTCTDNPSAQGHEVIEPGEDYFAKAREITSGNEYLIVYESGSSSGKYYLGSNTDLDKSNVSSSVTITNNQIAANSTTNANTFTISAVSGGYSIKSKSGYYIGSTSNSNKVDYSKTVAHVSTIDFESDNTAHIVSATSGCVLRYNSSATTFRYYRSASYDQQKAICLYKKVSKPGGSHIEYDTPVDIVGFEVSVSQTEYLHDQIFNPNTLTVNAIKTDGSRPTLTLGTDYTYRIKKAGTNYQIDPTKEFGEEGKYYLEISYAKYDSKSITLNVGYHTYITSITADSSKLTYNTADNLSDYLTGYLTADVEFNNETLNRTINYAEFASNGISVDLIDPNGVSKNINSTLAIPGEWTIKVYSSETPTVFGEVKINVSAILVESIVINNNQTVTVEETKTIQLTANVLPNNSYNKTITWSSSDESVATISTTGLVTAKKAGSTVIKATATDGSGIIGSITVNVTEIPDAGTFTLLESGAPTIGAYVMFARDYAASNIVMSKTARTNNFGSVTLTPSNKTLVREANSVAGAFKVVQGTVANSVGFYMEGSGYLYAPGGNNYLKYTSTLNAASSWIVSDNSSTQYAKHVVSQNTNITQRYLRPNTFNGNSIFSCYVETPSYDPEPLYIFQKGGKVVYPTSIGISGDNNCSINSTISLGATFEPSDTNYRIVTWTSSDPTVATVSNGVVTGLKEGKTTITVNGGKNGELSASIEVTVSPIPVTGVSLSKNSLSLTEGASDSLTATITPANATNQKINWISDDLSIATIEEGVVTAISVGETYVRVTSLDGSHSASCKVTVTAAPEIDDSQVTTSYQFSDKTWNTISGQDNWTSGKDGNGFNNGGVQVTTGSSGANCTSPLSFNGVYAITVHYCTNSRAGQGTVSLTVGGEEFGSKDIEAPTSNGTSEKTFSITGNGTLSGYVRLSVTCTTNSIYIIGIDITTGTPKPINPTGIRFSQETYEVYKGGTVSLKPEYIPSNANQNLDVSWKSSATSVATVDSTGKVTISGSASTNQTSTITATLVSDQTIQASCVIKVVEKQIDYETILIYLCGSDLESGSKGGSGGYATADIKEILSVANKPNDINIIIQTGGASSWKRYSINKNYSERYHVSNGSLVRDEQNDKVNMGASSSLQDFISYGLKNYPAQRMELILWNHGGAMRGVCYDEQQNTTDSLTNSEVKSAVKGAFDSVSRSYSDKFEWIGYDACLMQVQDIAEFNSNYFNYMVASEESEAGEGWEYSTWLDDAYAKKTTAVTLKAMCDGFVNSYKYSGNDQTLSYLDLSLASNYKSNWETMASAIYSLAESYGSTNVQNLFKSCKEYGTTVYTQSELIDEGYSTDSSNEDYYGYYGIVYSGGYYYDYGYTYFGIFDAKDVLNKLYANNAFKNARTQINNAITAFDSFVLYSKIGSSAGNSNGLCCFFPLGSWTNVSTYYTNSQTSFSSWRTFALKFGITK